MKKKDLIQFLAQKTLEIRHETLEIHCAAPETRIASSLSDIEIFVVLYYGRILNFNAGNLHWEHRDRLIVSKGHGAVSLYPILADLGFFAREKLKSICRQGSVFGSIPDCLVPGFETINGSLGQGLGEACGMALALKKKERKETVFVVMGDGELNEGSVWEAIMFAGHHRLNNLIAIIDQNKISMLDFCKNIIDLEPLEEKFRSFGFQVKTVDGHNVEKLYRVLKDLKTNTGVKPKVIIAHTKKGKGVPRLENDVLCHVKSLRKEEVARLIRGQR